MKTFGKKTNVNLNQSAASAAVRNETGNFTERTALATRLIQSVDRRSEAEAKQAMKTQTNETNETFHNRSADILVRPAENYEPRCRATASWTAPVLWRFGDGRRAIQSARGLAQSKTLRRFGQFIERAEARDCSH